MLRFAVPLGTNGARYMDVTLDAQEQGLVLNFKQGDVVHALAFDWGVVQHELGVVVMQVDDGTDLWGEQQQ